MKTLVRWTAFPAMLALTVLAMHLLPTYGVPAPAAQLLVFVTAVAAGHGLERWLPHGPSDRRQDGEDRRADIWSFGSVLMVDSLLKAASPALVASLLVLVVGSNAHGVFPEGLPFVAAVALAVLVSEFGGYWTHRLAHRGGWMWRIHAVHHSAERIYWLNSFRSHPLNIAWHHFSGAFVLMLLGTPEPVLLTALAIAGVAAVFQHLDADLRFGPLSYVFSTNEIHRWHHSTQRGESDRNYGSVLAVWDLVFGTYYNRRGAAPEALGLWGRKPLPKRYAQLLLAPFQHRFWESPAPRAQARHDDRSRG